jgi:DDE superfamily endonuclease
MQDLLDEFVAVQLHEAESQRYHEPRLQYRTRQQGRFEDDLYEGSGDEQPWLNEDEFKQKYRCSRESFKAILELIKDHPVFKERGPRTNMGRKQAPPAHQLMVFLKYLGTEGSGSSNSDLRNMFGIGKGTAEVYKKRVAKAIRALKKQTVFWPDEDERKEIAARIMLKYGWPNCVSIVDGTLFPLAFSPETEDAPDYNGRKYGYSITALIICDDQRLIRYYLAGWPGSAHDQRVFEKTKLFRNPLRYFSPRQYMLGDSAFENTWFIVAAYRKPAGVSIPREHEIFNDAMKPLRVISEHTIGILKGRFPWLRSIRCRIDENVESIKKVLEYIDCAIILHNLLIERKDEIPDEWMDLDDFSDIDEMGAAPGGDDEVLNQAVPDNAPSDQRRSDLMLYHNERHVM